MNIILGKDGKLSVNESPLQGKEAETLNNVLALIENPSDGDAIVYDADAGIWKAGAISGGGGSSGGGAFMVTVDDNDALDKTWKEIDTAFKSGAVVICDNFGGLNYLCAHPETPSPFSNKYSVEFFGYSSQSEKTKFSCDTENEYPTYVEP